MPYLKLRAQGDSHKVCGYQESYKHLAWSRRVDATDPDLQFWKEPLFFLRRFECQLADVGDPVSDFVDVDTYVIYHARIKAAFDSLDLERARVFTYPLASNHLMQRNNIALDSRKCVRNIHEAVLGRPRRKAEINAF